MTDGWKKPVAARLLGAAGQWQNSIQNIEGRGAAGEVGKIS